MRRGLPLGAAVWVGLSGCYTVRHLERAEERLAAGATDEALGELYAAEGESSDVRVRARVARLRRAVIERAVVEATKDPSPRRALVVLEGYRLAGLLRLDDPQILGAYEGLAARALAEDQAAAGRGDRSTPLDRLRGLAPFFSPIVGSTIASRYLAIVDEAKSFHLQAFEAADPELALLHAAALARLGGPLPARATALLESLREGALAVEVTVGPGCALSALDLTLPRQTPVRLVAATARFTVSACEARVERRYEPPEASRPPPTERVTRRFETRVAGTLTIVTPDGRQVASPFEYGSSYEDGASYGTWATFDAAGRQGVQGGGLPFPGGRGGAMRRFAAELHQRFLKAAEVAVRGRPWPVGEVATPAHLVHVRALAGSLGPVEPVYGVPIEDVFQLAAQGTLPPILPPESPGPVLATDRPHPIPAVAHDADGEDLDPPTQTEDLAGAELLLRDGVDLGYQLASSPLDSAALEARLSFRLSAGRGLELELAGSATELGGDTRGFAIFWGGRVPLLDDEPILLLGFGLGGGLETAASGEARAELLVRLGLYATPLPFVTGYVELAPNLLALKGLVDEAPDDPHFYSPLRAGLLLHFGDRLFAGASLTHFLGEPEARLHLGFQGGVRL